MLYVVLGILAVILLLLLIALVRTLFMKKLDPPTEPETDPKKALEYAQKLSRMVQYETVSKAEENPDKFRGFHEVLRKEFPHVFETCEVNEIEGCLLLRWPGKSSDAPVCFLAHMDVVEANPNDWSYPPFSGEIVDERIYGRGSGDTKCSLMAGFQAVEEAIIAGIVPEQDVWLASSCTEETGGQGAPRMAKWLQDHGIHFALLCDEGGAVTEEPISGFKGLYAMVGIYEKGFCNFKFAAHGKGGHSSAPPKGTPIPVLSKFVCAVEKKSPFIKKFTPEVEKTFEAFAPYGNFGYRFILGNLWLFKPLLLKILGGNAGAMFGTTCAFTMSGGSNGANVIPQEAYVIANLRVSPFQNSEDSYKAISKVAEKYGVTTEILESRDASKPVDFTGKGFALVQEAEKAIFKDIPLVPYVVTGGTDARSFECVSDTVMRFSPVVYTNDSMGRMHGIDEYLDYKCLPNAVAYFTYIIKNVNKLK